MDNKMEIQLAVINSHHGVTVKDVPAKEFISAYAKYLKRGNKIRIPEVSKELTSSYHIRVLVATRSIFNAFVRLF